MYVKLKISKAIQRLIVCCFILCFGLLISGMVTAKIPQAPGDPAPKEEGVKVPILMYHSLLKASSAQGRYTISPDWLESDLKYIQENGYTTITVKDLTDYVFNDKPLPAKPVMLTFDDGHYNNYAYALPLLKKYKAKAIMSPILKEAEKFSELEEKDENSAIYGYCSFEDLKEMVDSGCFEIQNHSYDMHGIRSGRYGATQRDWESDADYRAALIKDTQTAQDLITQKTGTTPLCYTYPLGARSKDTESILRELGFKVSLSCTEVTSSVSKDPESLYFLG
ncbi:MAG: polysaccharide deacetylase family protein, partial [Oscillospiraceae bacterium]|nr:polysaccharide deacetylase family protein [Oscillospiraceae bacterium]